MSGDNFFFDGEGLKFSHLLGLVSLQQGEANAKKAEQTRRRAAGSNVSVHQNRGSIATIVGGR